MVLCGRGWQKQNFALPLRQNNKSKVLYTYTCLGGRTCRRARTREKVTRIQTILDIVENRAILSNLTQIV